MASFLWIFAAFLLTSYVLDGSFAAPNHSNLDNLDDLPSDASSAGAEGASAAKGIPSNELAAPRRQIFTKFPDPVCKRVGGCSEPIDPVDPIEPPIDPVDPVIWPCAPPRGRCPPLELEASSADAVAGRFPIHNCWGPQIYCNGSCCLGNSPRCCGGKCCLGGEALGLTCCLPSPTSNPATAGTCCSTRNSFCCGGTCCKLGSTCCNGKCCAGGVKCCGGQCGCPEKSSCCGGSECCSDALKPQCCSIPGQKGGECCPQIDKKGEETNSFCCGRQCCKGSDSTPPRCCYSPKTGPRCCSRPIGIPIDIPIGLPITP